MLCAQFLRDYADLEILANVQPEDIEDVTERYHVYLGVEFETDTVKRIRLPELTQDVPIYLVAIIGIDVASETPYARAFDYRGIEFSRKPFKFSNNEVGFEMFKPCSTMAFRLD